jgi:sigma-B regulation protein RsbU (phosphoserine phosphatase)
LLNEPFFLVILNLALWTSGAIIYAVVLNVEDPGKTYIARVFFQTIITGLITSVASFFLTEHALRKNLASAFFPDGGLFGTPGTLRIRIGTRLAFLILSCNVIPCLVFFIIVRGTYQTEVAPEIMILALRDTIQTNTLLFFVTGVSLAVIVSRSLTVPIKEIVSLLKNISHGDLNEKIQVISNDEIGYTGDVINEMIDALRDREMIRHSLQLAHEVQLSLLPEREPKTAFCDISGVSIYCEQTGGDYYDFIEFENPADRKLGIVVGDVSGHGLPAALLMSTARAMIRTVSSVQDALARVVSSVNSHLARDIGESGQFMTLFYLVVDGRNRTLRWVRAGHDPALLYTPETDNFVELEGPGLALGIDHRYDYIESERGFSTGQIILIGTDGLWEAINIKNEMLGKDRIKTAVRQNAMRSAAEIKDSILSVVKEHRGIRKLEDDMTFTVIKGC